MTRLDSQPQYAPHSAPKPTHLPCPHRPTTAVPMAPQVHLINERILPTSGVKEEGGGYFNGVR